MYVHPQTDSQRVAPLKPVRSNTESDPNLPLLLPRCSAGRGLAMAVQQARGTIYRAPVSVFHTSDKSPFKVTDKREADGKNKVHQRHATSDTYRSDEMCTPMHILVAMTVQWTYLRQHFVEHIGAGLSVLYMQSGPSISPPDLRCTRTKSGEEETRQTSHSRTWGGRILAIPPSKFRLASLLKVSLIFRPNALVTDK